MKPPRKMTKAELLEAAKANGFNYLSRLECPDRFVLHAEGLPKDFNPTTGLSKTHRQERCPTCGYWSLWTSRPYAGGRGLVGRHREVLGGDDRG